MYFEAKHGLLRAPIAAQMFVYSQSEFRDPSVVVAYIRRLSRVP